MRAGNLRSCFQRRRFVNREERVIRDIGPMGEKYSTLKNESKLGSSL